MLARTHIEQDAAKVFEAVVLAMAAQQAEEATWRDGPSSGSGMGQDGAAGAAEAAEAADEGET
jgi:hypothetical protein